MRPRPCSLGPLGLILYNLFYWPYLLSSTVVLFFPALLLYLATFWQRSRRWLHTYTSYWAAHYLAWAPYASVRVEGREHARSAGPVVFVVNHQSMVDILAVYATHLPFLWVSKIENFYAPFLGWNMWLNGYVPIRRGYLPSILRMLRTCQRRLRGGQSLCVFPEGTRSKDGALKPFYRGAFWIAARNGVPVVPIVVEGTGAILAKGAIGIRPQEVIVRILEPMRAAPGERDGRELQRRVFQRMERELAIIRQAPSVGQRKLPAAAVPAEPLPGTVEALSAGAEDVAALGTVSRAIVPDMLVAGSGSGSREE